MKEHFETIFNLVLMVLYILYFVIFFKIAPNAHKYLEITQEILKYYVIFFLLIRFNPFTRTKFTDLDRRVVFSASLFLLTTTTLTNYANQTLDYLHIRMFKF